jgi:Caudovirus prohead serine protease
LRRRGCAVVEPWPPAQVLLEPMPPVRVATAEVGIGATPRCSTWSTRAARWSGGGAFNKTLSDWSQARSRIPLLADHELSTAGVIGSVMQATGDGRGLRIRAKFSTTQKAQNVRAHMVGGHIKGL